MNENKTPLQPCRKNVSRTGVKKALTAFVGTCGAAAVMTLALNSGSLSAQPVNVKGACRVDCVTTVPASGPACTSMPATKPGEPTTRAVPLGGKPIQIRIETN